MILRPTGLREAALPDIVTPRIQPSRGSYDADLLASLVILTWKHYKRELPTLIQDAPFGEKSPKKDVVHLSRIGRV